MIQLTVSILEEELGVSYVLIFVKRDNKKMMKITMRKGRMMKLQHVERKVRFNQRKILPAGRE